MNYTLAINPAVEGFGTHDPAAVLFADGDLVFGVEEGRLLGRKRAPETFPTASIRRCLDSAGVTIEAVDRVLVPWEQPIGGTGGDARSERNRAAIERRLTEVGRPTPPIELWNHHRCHAESAAGPSGFEEALVVTADGRGGQDSTVVWHAADGRLERIERYPAPNSLGYLYAAVTGYLGFQPFRGEGKVMALAPYGESAAETALRGALEGGPAYDVTPLVGSGVPTAITRLESLLDVPRAVDRNTFDSRQQALAHDVQTFLKETVVSIVETHCAELGLDRVCLAGGVALNCKLNQRIAALDAVEELFVQPVAHDAGAAVGAALAAGVVRELPRTLYWGPSAQTSAVEGLLDRRRIDYSTPENLVERTAELLAEGQLIGWFQGRLEAGPRALGNRSILADPRSPAARERVNGYVKGRASWRPFAPSVPVESAARYFEGPLPTPYMIRTLDTNAHGRTRVPAVVHPADGTARTQTVRRTDNPRFHRLLTAVGEQTGVPVLLNTSLNASGDPIAATPEDALSVFHETGLDALVIENCLLEA
ncbi:MAG: carbamoyltransferase C-terminal domain-containing protein [Natronomonas sp.]